MQETLIRFQGQEDPLEKGQATHSSISGLPWWLRWKRICLQCRRPGFAPGLGRSPGGGRGDPLQCSCREGPHGQRSLAAAVGAATEPGTAERSASHTPFDRRAHRYSPRFFSSHWCPSISWSITAK